MSNNEAMLSFLARSSPKNGNATKEDATGATDQPKNASSGASAKADMPSGTYDDAWLEDALTSAGVEFTTTTKRGTTFFNVSCPNEREHTAESASSGTSCWIYNGWPVFKCQHSHCKDWKFADFAAAVGIDYKGTGAAPGSCDDSGEVTHYYSDFYEYDKNGQPSRTLDPIIARWIRDNNTFFYMGGTAFFYEGGRYVEDTTGKMKGIIQSCIVPRLCTDSRVASIHRMVAYQQGVTRNYKDLNQYPSHWVAFKNGMFDPITGEMHPHSPDYYCVNQIPHEYHPSANPMCPTYTALLETQMPDPDTKEMWLEFCGMCFIRDTRFQKFMFLKGLGGSGKSVQMDTLIHCLGEDNVANETIHALCQRFNATNLFGKLANICADVGSNDLEQVDVIKRITGEDKRGVKHERKGKDSFPFTPFCKLLFSANKMPHNKDEQTNAFYRRLLIVPIVAYRGEPDVLLPRKLEAETNGIIHLFMDALSRLFARGRILESRESQIEVRQLRCETDSVIAFLDERCSMSADASIERKKLYEAYRAFCEDEEWKYPIVKKQFYERVRNEGVSEVKVNGYDFFRGIRPRD